MKLEYMKRSTYNPIGNKIYEVIYTNHSNLNIFNTVPNTSNSIISIKSNLIGLLQL